MKLKRNDIVLISSEEYSHYGILDTFRVVKAFDTATVMKNYLSRRPRQTEEYHFENDKFITYLIDHNYVKELKTKEWHISDYDTANFF